MDLDERKNNIGEEYAPGIDVIKGHAIAILDGENLSRDFAPCDLGVEKCKPSHTWGPGIRTYYLFHLVVDGQGKFTVKGKEYSVYKNQAFLIRPEEVISYTADSENPWSYAWFGIQGERAKTLVERVAKGKVVFDIRPELIYELTGCVYSTYDDVELSYRLTAFIYKFLSAIYGGRKETHKRSDIVKTAVRFIENNYFYPFDVSWLANELGISRTHFSTLFSSAMGDSPYNYLTKYRIAKAEKLLIERDDLSVTEVAYSVGFSSIERFSEMFKKYTALSPLAYRKKNLNP